MAINRDLNVKISREELYNIDHNYVQWYKNAYHEWKENSAEK